MTSTSKYEFEYVMNSLIKIIKTNDINIIYIIYKEFFNESISENILNKLKHIENNIESYSQQDIDDIYIKQLDLCKNTLNDIILLILYYDEEGYNRHDVKYNEYMYYIRFMKPYPYKKNNILDKMFHHIFCYNVLMKEYTGKYSDEIINKVKYCLMINMLMYNTSQSNNHPSICAIKSLIVFVKKLKIYLNEDINNLSDLYDRYINMLQDKIDELNLNTRYIIRKSVNVIDKNDDLFNEIFNTLIFNNMYNIDEENYDIMTTELIYDLYIYYTKLCIGGKLFYNYYYKISDYFEYFIKFKFEINDEIINELKKISSTLNEKIIERFISFNDKIINNMIVFLNTKENITLTSYTASKVKIVSLHEIIKEFYEIQIENNNIKHIYKPYFNELINKFKPFCNTIYIANLFGLVFTSEFINYIYKINDELPFCVMDDKTYKADKNDRLHAMCGYYDSGVFFTYDPNNTINTTSDKFDYNYLINISDIKPKWANSPDVNYYKDPFLIDHTLFGGNIFQYIIYLLILIIVIVIIVLLVKNKREHKYNFNYIK